MRALISIVSTLVVLQFIAVSNVFAIKGSDLDLNGYIGLEEGQMVRARYQLNTYDHLWLGATIGRINVTAPVSDRTTLIIGMEGRAWGNTFPPQNIRNQNFMYTFYYDYYFHQAQGIYTAIKNENLLVELAGGLMPYKYNPDARNLGEYLFRSGTYPAYILNSFDFPMARLTGGRISCHYKTETYNMGLDLFALTEREMRPFHDLSIAAVANVGFLKAVDFGAGIDFAHLVAVQDTMTSSRRDDNLYIKKTDKGFDTLPYTYRGIKMMARATIDPLFFMRNEMSELLGNGGKIYGELAILGLENYPASASNNKYGYDKLMEKIPMMFGVTIPAWKILDVCNLEFEYFGCRYPDSYDQIIRYGFPLPSLKYAYDSTVYLHDNWKWSAYLKKDLSKNIGLILQVARDHSRWETQGAYMENADFEAALVQPNEWAWRSKLEFRF